MWRQIQDDHLLEDREGWGGFTKSQPILIETSTDGDGDIYDDLVLRNIW
jgi:hypothetical protein